MDLRGRPLLDTRLDRPLYLHRPIHDEVLRALQHHNNVLVLGRRGAGKTTLLHQVAADMRATGTDAVEVEGRLAASGADLIRLIRSRLLPSNGQPRSYDMTRRELLSDVDAKSRWDETGEVQEPLEVLAELADDLGEEPRVVLCDEPAPGVAHTLFGRLRDELWRLPITWVVTGNDADEAAFLTPPADAFFERVLRIPDLTEDEQARLLELRADTEPVDRQLAGDRGATPRELLHVTRAVLEGATDARSATQAIAELDARASALGRPAAMAYAELRSLGPVSASDQRFLDRLGWTRERAVQVLNRMEAEGVLESFTERSQRGRPRKLYRIREAL